jgi:hypothetical protein
VLTDQTHRELSRIGRNYVFESGTRPVGVCGLSIAPEARDKHEVGWAHYLGRLKTISKGCDPGVDPLADLSVVAKT